VKIYVADVEALKKKEKQDETSLPPKLVKKLIWLFVILFCKIFIPSERFDTLLCQNLPF
jgi:hypothetical protein